MTLLPFVRTGDLIELHCVQLDPTFQALCRSPRVAFLVSEFLGVFPSDWVDLTDGARGSTVFRAVNFECIASFDTSPAAVAGALTRMLAAYEPDAANGQIKDGGQYAGRLRQLAYVSLRIVNSQAKFKIGPAGADERSRRAAAAASFRRRNLPGDVNAADWIDYYNELRRSDGSWSE